LNKIAALNTGRSSMSGSTRFAGGSRVALFAAAASLALAACNQNGAPAASNQLASNALAPAPLAALPLASDTTAPAIAPAPPAEALPAAAPARVARLADQGQAYAFADRAASMNAGFGDAPPDYTYDYGGGQRPWVWRADDQSARIAEPLPGGAYRYYYYEPGQSAPYLVRDSGYSYGYDNGALVVVYGPDGRLLPPGELERRADVAGRILARAAAMRRAAESDRREAVAAANWTARRDQLSQEREQWARAQQAQADWRAYHEANRARDDADWAAARYRRESEAAQFARQVHDAGAEQRDLEAARRARQLAAGGPPSAPRPPAGPSSSGGPPPPQRWAGPGPFGPPGGPQGGQAQDQARARAEANRGARAQAEAARQAQLVAARQQTNAAQAAQDQAAVARRAELVAARRQADAQAAARAGQAQAGAARQAQLIAARQQAQEQAQAAQQAQVQAEAARLAAQRQDQVRAQAAQAAQAQAAAAHRAEAAAARQKAQGQTAAGKATNSAHVSPRNQQ
jgi:hypothetical protein